MEDYIQVKDACKILKICRRTLYAWGDKGKIEFIRDPVWNFRLYKRKDVEKLAKSLDQS